jgi:Mn-containing catalase
LLDGKGGKEDMIHQAMVNPQFLNESAGSPILSDSNGNPWTAAYVTANGDLTVDLRSNIAAESRAKIVYEYLMKFTDDRYVKETLMFLMTREVAHFEMFEAALQNIKPNFPPGVMQPDPRYTNKYFNMSNGMSSRGPWNEGKSPILGETWEYIEDPVSHVLKTNGLLKEEVKGTDMTREKARDLTKKLGDERSSKIKSSIPQGENQWSEYK